MLDANNTRVHPDHDGQQHLSMHIASAQEYERIINLPRKRSTNLKGEQLWILLAIQCQLRCSVGSWHIAGVHHLQQQLVACAHCLCVSSQDFV